MRKPSLTADTFAAALALVAAGASAGCSKADNSAAAPVPSTESKPSEARPAANTPPAPPVAATPAASASGAAGDGGIKPNSKASCGAGTCSADMKKGGN